MHTTLARRLALAAALVALPLAAGCGGGGSGSGGVADDIVGAAGGDEAKVAVQMGNILKKHQATLTSISAEAQKAIAETGTAAGSDAVKKLQAECKAVADDLRGIEAGNEAAKQIVESTIQAFDQCSEASGEAAIAAATSGLGSAG